MSYTSKAVVLKSVPQGAPTRSEFEISTFTVSKENLKLGHLIVKLLYISIDPYMIGKIRGISSYTVPYKVGEPLYGHGYAEVVESQSGEFEKGDHVVSDHFKWQEYQDVVATDVEHAIQGIDPETHLSILGLNGLTAFFGLLEIGQPKEGETVLVSAAAGATGGLVGQIAKIVGCKVVGTAGSDVKCQYALNELGFDNMINYKAVQSLPDAVKQSCPNGVDVYFDNVGGHMLDAAMFNMNRFGRSVECGTISQYGTTEIPKGLRWESTILEKRIKMQGFIVLDFKNRFGQALEKLTNWYKQGKLKERHTVHDGIESAPKALLDLLKGGNIGKMLVKVF